ncbi:MAG: DNA alkylation repair protein [Chloroflexi bacterium]|nr:DNA alkylation repair protein [Chloroflexota bacterium]
MKMIADRIEERLREVGTPERAPGEKRYLKSDLAFLGATVGQIRDAVRDVARAHPDLAHGELVELVEELWSMSIHEGRMAAVLFLCRYGGLLNVDDLPLIERLVRASKTWALVDYLASDVLGSLVGHQPDDVSPVMDRWATDDDFWIRRASLLAELRPIRGGAPLDRFLHRAEPMLGEKEFFIRKAIGWVLREAAKRRPVEVTDWLASRTHRASGVTMREAVRHLPVAERERLMDAYRARRPLA